MRVLTLEEMELVAGGCGSPKARPKKSSGCHTSKPRCGSGSHGGGGKPKCGGGQSSNSSSSGGCTPPPVVTPPSI